MEPKKFCKQFLHLSQKVLNSPAVSKANILTDFLPIQATLGQVI